MLDTLDGISSLMDLVECAAQWQSPFGCGAVWQLVSLPSSCPRLASCSFLYFSCFEKAMNPLPSLISTWCWSSSCPVSSIVILVEHHCQARWTTTMLLVPVTVRQTTCAPNHFPVVHWICRACGVRKQSRMNPEHKFQFTKLLMNSSLVTKTKSRHWRWLWTKER